MPPRSRTTFAIVSAMLLACSSAPSSKRAPPPEFDDLDVGADSDVEGSAPRQPGPGSSGALDNKRAVAILAELPIRERMRGYLDGRIAVTGYSELRATAEDEPGDIADVMSVSTSDRHRVRFEGVSYYSGKPPYRLEAGSELMEVDGRLEYRFDFRNHPKALWIRVTRRGAVQPPVRRPPSRETLFSYLALTDPEIAIGTSVTVPSFDPETQGDKLERITVRAKGEEMVDGRELPTVVLDHDVDGRPGESIIAGGRYTLRLRGRNFDLWRAPRTPRDGE
jgi:hypothetical protein